MKKFHFPLTTLLAFVFVLVVPGVAPAHFLWIVTKPSEQQAAAIVFFGEDPQDQAYHLPESLATLELIHRTTAGEVDVSLESVEMDDLVGLRSTEEISQEGLLETGCQYGIYHGTLLTYYAKHYLSDDSVAWQVLKRSPRLRLDGVPQVTNDRKRLILEVTWDGKPISNVAVSLRQGDQVAEKASTNSEGKADLPLAQDGLTSVLLQFTDPDASGQLGDEAYHGAMFCTTITFPIRRSDSSPTTSEVAPAGALHADSQKPMPVPPLPTAVASFGAVATNGWLYVYGGHTGREHQHSRDNLAQQFVRIALTEPTRWEVLPMQTPVQGVALVAHDGHIYRIGGMSARNTAGEPDELYSLAEFARFDPSTRQWTDLSPLPGGRSSHDAAVLGNTIYVIGGWHLAGQDDGEWHQHGLKIELNQPEPNWEELPGLPFQRRALAVTTLQDHVVVIGGMNSDSEVVRDVEAFDPQTGTWRSIAPLPGEGMNGFGVAAWNLNGIVYANGSDGTLYSLRSLDGTWQPVAQFRQPRFFHRLVPRDETTLLGVAGASMKSHLSDTEEIVLLR